MSPDRLLVIDDEPDIGAFIGDVAEGLGFEVTVTDNADDFWASYGDRAPSVIMLDLNMPQVDGVELLRSLGEKRCRAHVVIVSGVDSRVLRTARQLGETYGLNMLGVLEKPIELKVLKETLGKVAREMPTITEADLRRAIDGGEIVAHYQPKANLGSARLWDIFGCEALARWRHPRHGVLSPGMFIPLAESSGLISPLTDRVLNLAVRQLRRWRDEGLDLSVAVNIAPQLLSDLTLPDRISGLTREHDVEPTRLMLEITESGAMTDAAMTMDILTRFRLKGFGLSIDDFGTGYSSLVQLHRMPFNEMKVDQSFVFEIGENEETEKIIRSIVDLGHNLGLSLCAEGIENEKALMFLRSVGCEAAQGYLISKPVPAEDLAEFVGASSRNSKPASSSA